MWSLLLAEKMLFSKWGAEQRLYGRPVGKVQADSEHWWGMSLSGTSPSGAWAIKWGQEGHSVPDASSKSVSNKWTVCLNFPMFYQTFGTANQFNIEISSPRGCRAERIKVQIVASKLCLVRQSSHEVCGILLFGTFQFEHNCSFWHHCSFNITFEWKYLPDEIHTYKYSTLWQTYALLISIFFKLKLYKENYLAFEGSIHCIISHGYFVFYFYVDSFLLRPFSPMKNVLNEAVW